MEVVLGDTATSKPYRCPSTNALCNLMLNRDCIELYRDCFELYRNCIEPRVV